MGDQPQGDTPISSAEPRSPAPVARGLALRRPIPRWQAILLGVLCVVSVAGLWWAVTLGPKEERLVNYLILPSPAETFGKFPELWFEYALARNMVATLSRVAIGFALAVVVGVPLGIAAGCFPRLQAFLMPLLIFGRNIPIAALIPLVVFIINFSFLFGKDENTKIFFIFIACVAFIISDTAQAIADVSERYVDTALTLGASRWQTIMKVLVPLALPAVFGTGRLMFGIAFGYIMLAEMSHEGGFGGVGYQISLFQKRGNREGVYLIILFVPLVALLVDQFLYAIQRSLFPHQYSGNGWLAHGCRAVMHGWDDLKQKLFGVPPAAQAFLAANRPQATPPVAPPQETQP